MQILVDIGMTLLMIALLPQLWKTWKNRNTLKDINLLFAVLTVIGDIFCITWAFIYTQWAILLLNLMYMIWSILSIYFMVRNKRRFERLCHITEDDFCKICREPLLDDGRCPNCN